MMQNHSIGHTQNTSTRNASVEDHSFSPGRRGDQLGSDGSVGMSGGRARAHAHSPLSPDTTCACSCGQTSSQADCLAPSSRMPCWAPTPCRLSWATMTPRSTWATMPVSSASPLTRPENWRRGSWSCTGHTGEGASAQGLPLLLEPSPLGPRCSAVSTPPGSAANLRCRSEGKSSHQMGMVVTSCVTLNDLLGPQVLSSCDNSPSLVSENRSLSLPTGDNSNCCMSVF